MHLKKKGDYKLFVGQKLRQLQNLINLLDEAQTANKIIAATLIDITIINF